MAIRFNPFQGLFNSPQYHFISGPQSDEKHFRWQCDMLSNALLLDDPSSAVPISQFQVKSSGPNVDFLTWSNKGELVAGSFMSKFVNSNLKANDIDIYFKSKEDAMEFAANNNMWNSKLSDSNFCGTAVKESQKINLIWGIEYDSPEKLVSSFDIRACAIAYDPNNKTITYVHGAKEDCNLMVITFNPTPRQVSINRLVKYTVKGFSIDKYQRLFFAELVRTERYNPELELTTGYGGK